MSEVFDGPNSGLCAAITAQVSIDGNGDIPSIRTLRHQTVAEDILMCPVTLISDGQPARRVVASAGGDGEVRRP